MADDGVADFDFRESPNSSYAPGRIDPLKINFFSTFAPGRRRIPGIAAFAALPPFCYAAKFVIEGKHRKWLKMGKSFLLEIEPFSLFPDISRSPRVSVPVAPEKPRTTPDGVATVFARDAASRLSMRQCRPQSLDIFLSPGSR